MPDETSTQALGAALARALIPGLKIYLRGELGAGKTSLTRALVQSAGHAGRVKSPTYTLVEPYTIEVQGKPLSLMHFDLYRMGSPEEFIEAGFREVFDSDHLCVVEWPEQAEGCLPAADLDVFLAVEGEGRGVELLAHSEQGEACLHQLDLHWTR